MLSAIGAIIGVTLWYRLQSIIIVQYFLNLKLFGSSETLFVTAFFSFSIIMTSPVAGSTAPRYPLLLVKIGMEVFLVLITAGTGVIESVLQIASESLGGFIRS
jgi:hypothetical protein